MTRKNAGSLASEADALMTLIRQFRIDAAPAAVQGRMRNAA
ncbi:hypothetical protein [Rhizobium sp. Root1203]|nr:hypothetical protein [Rhizobium sp. Root1203]